jgi:hypothetical protein
MNLFRYCADDPVDKSEDSFAGGLLLIPFGAAHGRRAGRF